MKSFVCTCIQLPQNAQANSFLQTYLANEYLGYHFDTASRPRFSIEMLVGFKMSHKCLLSVSVHAARLPRITTHPQQLKDAVPGETLAFTVQASGTEPLNHQWEIKTGDESGEWQSCDVESFPGANSSTLTIPSVQKSDEGSYRCTVSNIVGTQTSKPVKLSVGKIQASSTCTKHLHKCVHCISTCS